MMKALTMGEINEMKIGGDKMMRSGQWSQQSLSRVGLFCIVSGSLMLTAVVFMKPWGTTSQIVADRVRLSITPIQTEEEPTTPGVIGEIGIEEKPSEASIPEEEKPVAQKSPDPSMMIPEKELDENVILIGGTKLPKAEKITQILVDKGEKLMHITLIADRKIGDYNCLKLKEPPRLAIDMSNVQAEYPKSLIHVDHPLLKRVRLEKHFDKTRFVFESARPHVPLFRVRRVGNRLVVSFGQVYPP
jgi:hypothetical protein